MNALMLRKLFPKASEDFIKANQETFTTVNSAQLRALPANDKSPDTRTSSLSAPKQKPPKRLPLEQTVSGEEEGGSRAEIHFRISATRPNDWDNPWTKALQDCLVECGILHSDAWNHLQGRCITEKAAKKTEEKTIVELYLLP